MTNQVYSKELDNRTFCRSQFLSADTIVGRPLKQQPRSRVSPRYPRFLFFLGSSVLHVVALREYTLSEDLHLGKSVFFTPAALEQRSLSYPKKGKTNAEATYFLSLATCRSSKRMPRTLHISFPRTWKNSSWKFRHATRSYPIPIQIHWHKAEGDATPGTTLESCLSMHTHNDTWLLYPWKIRFLCAVFNRKPTRERRAS
jgi:hypothetical protein